MIAFIIAALLYMVQFFPVITLSNISHDKFGNITPRTLSALASASNESILLNKCLMHLVR